MTQEQVARELAITFGMTTGKVAVILAGSIRGAPPRDQIVDAVTDPKRIVVGLGDFVAHGSNVQVDPRSPGVIQLE